jgi:hypothetical protein
MSRMIDCRLLAVLAAAALSFEAGLAADTPKSAHSVLTGALSAGRTLSQSDQPVNASARALADVHSRIAEYVALHKKLEGTIPRLSQDATPEAIDKHHRALAQMLQQARRGAKPGDIFPAPARAVIRHLLNGIFGGPDGAALRASIMDENPGSLKIMINARYPDSVPLSTMPPQVLQGLPRLPDELEYRFLGDRLILMDVHAHTIVDVIDHALGR